MRTWKVLLTDKKEKKPTVYTTHDNVQMQFEDKDKITLSFIEKNGARITVEKWRVLRIIEIFD